MQFVPANRSVIIHFERPKRSSASTQLSEVANDLAARYADGDVVKKNSERSSKFRISRKEKLSAPIRDKKFLANIPYNNFLLICVSDAANGQFGSGG